MRTNCPSEFMSWGEGSEIYPYALIIKPSKISIGKSVRIDDFARLEGGEGISIGDFTHISSFSSILAGGKAILGRFVGLAQGAKLITGSGFPFENQFDIKLNIKDPYVRRKDEIIIGDYGIIACNAVVLPGVTVGKGGILAANSVAIKDIPEWEIWAGNPAKYLKKRERADGI